MQTHEDRQHVEWFERLKERAVEGEQNKTSQITTGLDGEESLASWRADNGVHVTHMPDDEQGILRISAGGGSTPVPLNYCVIRGAVGECIELLEKAIVALKQAP